jgi:UPF0716 protein FxsA
VLAPLLILFIVVPILELYVIIQIGQSIGALPTIALLIADSILGSMLMRSQGRAAWRRFNEALAAGRPPAREVIDGALVIFGGALLLTPGFVTDIFGLFLLLPPTRAFARRLLVRNFSRRLVVGMATGPRGPVRPRPPGGARSPGYDVEGTATDIDPDPPRLP